MEELEKLSHSQIEQELMPRSFGIRGKIWVGFLVVLCAVGIIAYIRQLKFGLSVTGMGDYVSWGLYISNFVFFVAISLVGSLITAILRLANVSWSTPLTRIAEFIAVSAILFASLVIIVDMGRPDRFLNLFLHGRIQSPILWDVIVITVYMLLCVLMLYFSILPDVKILLKNLKPSSVLYKLYAFIGGFWENSKPQRALRDRAVQILIVCVVPVAFAIHTVTSWLFATTFRPGWDSTNFGPYFVSGAFLVGAAAVVVVMYVIRQSYQLQSYITEKHFDHMGKLVVLLTLLYLYFNINEYLVPGFKMKKMESEHLHELFVGDSAILFWSVLILSMVVPMIVLIFRSGRRPLPMFLICILVVVGAWFKRFLIVTPTMLHPLLPKDDTIESFLIYSPTWEEWSITAGSLAGALLLITLFIRIFPPIPIQETIDEQEI